MPRYDITAGHYYSQLMTSAYASCRWPAAARFTDRVRTVHEKTDRTQYPNLRQQFRPTQDPIRFTGRRVHLAWTPAYFSITPLVQSPANAV